MILQKTGNSTKYYIYCEIIRSERVHEKERVRSDILEICVLLNLMNVQGITVFILVVCVGKKKILVVCVKCHAVQNCLDNKKIMTSSLSIKDHPIRS